MSMFRTATSQVFADARHGQVAALSVLIFIGVWAFSFEMPWWRPVTALVTAISTQLAISMLMRTRFDWRSATITALSLTLLLRTDGPWLIVLAAIFAIGSKALLRWDGRHFFNPAAFGIACTVMAFEGAWVSPGQWGTGGLIGPVAVAIGLAVTYGARRLEVPLAFLAFWAMLSFARALWLGDPLTIPIHQMSSGMLIVFAFFMISDPMTMPWQPSIRLAWTALVATTGFALQHTWVVDAGPIFGLLAMAPLVPVLNHFFPAPAARWRPSLAKGDPKCVPS
jgi:Na+-transporting NADH:ubiquinone oxidoreductase subunit NqrB